MPVQYKNLCSIAFFFATSALATNVSASNCGKDLKIIDAHFTAATISQLTPDNAIKLKALRNRGAALCASKAQSEAVGVFAEAKQLLGLN